MACMYLGRCDNLVTGIGGLPLPAETNEHINTPCPQMLQSPRHDKLQQVC
jgi:hypothetical protein